MTWLDDSVIILTVIAAALLSAGHALLYKRDPRSALGWIVISLTLPLLGPICYWILGVNRISARARRWQEEGRRLAGWDTSGFRPAPLPAAALPAGCPQFDELRRLADRVVSSPLVAGNLVEPLYNGEAAYPAMLAAINDARHSIHLCSYICDGDVTGQRFASALSAAAARGVEVRLLVDALGEKYSWPRFRSLLADSQVQVARFLPLRQGVYLNLRNHRKLLVVDGNCAFTGGMNLGDRHLVERNGGPPPVADLHFRVSGPVVAELQRTFLEDWYFVTRQLLSDRSYFPPLDAAGPALVRGIADGPDKEFPKLHWIIGGALACARSSVRIVTPYLIPDRALLTALATAALRGVAVRILLPAENNLPFVHWASRAYLWELLQYGIEIAYQPPPFNHSKLLVVDDCWTLLGSANLDPRSLRLNFEFNLEVYDPQLAAHLGAWMDARWQASRGVSLAEVDARPLPEKLRDGFAKLLSPYL